MEEHFKFIGDKLYHRMSEYAKDISEKGEESLDRMAKLPDFLHESANQLNEILDEYFPEISETDFDEILEYAKPIINDLNRRFVTSDELLD
ncbi:MAG TPA: hypothetical protein VEC12_09050 [Bacteroidia bacterium]|nr:hypothetical protein [Bacteroidia bacterium]